MGSSSLSLSNDPGTEAQILPLIHNIAQPENVLYSMPTGKSYKKKEFKDHFGFMVSNLIQTIPYPKFTQ
jgi:hypothetical protein